jgi:3,4-dihydroxy-2-butanone 4-phosphate synthase
MKGRKEERNECIMNRPKKINAFMISNRNGVVCVCLPACRSTRMKIDIIMYKKIIVIIEKEF